MRKIFALLALVLGVVSCQTEPEGFDATVGGEKEVNITVALPEATRANSALGAFDNIEMGQYDIRYIFQVFNAEGTEYKTKQVVCTDATTVSFPVRLIPNRTYNFVVWADLVENGKTENAHYTIGDSLEEITLNEWAPMDESRDAYTGKESVEFNGNPITVTLTRPFAKLRVKTTDMKELMDVVPAKAKVTYTTKHYEGFNALEQSPVSQVIENKTHETFNIVSYGENVDEGKKTLFTDYFFATAQQQEEVNFTLEVFEVVDGNDVRIVERAFNTAIPVQRNYLTTIEGNILTTGDNITVVIDDEFDGYYDYTIPSEVSELVNVINSAVDGVETIIPVNDDIELPQALTIPAGKNIVLELGDNEVSGALVVEDGAKLTINNGTIKNEDKTVSGITTNGNLTLNNVEIESARHAVRVESGEVVIYGGTFEVKPVSNSTLHALNVGDDGTTATVIIKGGTFRGPKGTMADSGSAVNVRNGSTVIIEGGNFSGGKTKTLSAAAGATLIVKGGFFDQDPSAFVATDYTAIDMNTTRSATKDYVYAVMKGEEVNDHYEILIEDTAALDFFAEVVDYEYTFAGDVVKLTDDIDLSAENWNPIGDNRKDNAAFSGTFDGQNHTISGAKITGDFCFNGAVYGSKEGWGLFSVTDGATIKNLKVDGAIFGSYTVISGTIAAYANNTTFENIDITNSKVAGYNWYTGGVVGWAAGECTFKDVNLDETVAVGTLWDSHGQNAGGIAGGVSSSAKITIEDCNIACVMDVINDVTSNYKWYIYRVSGMIIGNTNTTETKYNEVVTATATNVTCTNVTVTYGKWMNYHYCEGFWNRGWGRYESSDYIGGVDEEEPHNHAEGEEHCVCIPFDQLFGGSSNGTGHYPVKGLAEFPGVTVVYPAEYTCPICGEQHNVK